MRPDGKGEEEAWGFRKGSNNNSGCSAYRLGWICTELADLVVEQAVCVGHPIRHHPACAVRAKRCWRWAVDDLPRAVLRLPGAGKQRDAVRRGGFRMSPPKASQNG
jgi:hypothetical protein